MALTILQIIPSLAGGGVETGTVDLARALINQGHHVIVISSGGSLVHDLESAGAIHYTLPVHRKSPWVILGLVSRVAEIIESHSVDVIHARSRVPAIIGYLAWRKVAAGVSFRLGDRQRIPCFITTAHGYYAEHLVSQVMGWGRFVIAISQRIARHMMDHFHVPADRIRLIPRGVDLGQFLWSAPRREVPKGEWHVAMIGRITPLKGHRDLVRAFSIVVKTFPKARLFIVGKAAPEHEKYLRELKLSVARLGLEKQVEFTGHKSDVPGFLRQTDLAVLPSTGQEGFGRVLIEASAAGVPMVATDVGGISEIVVHRKTGLLVPAGDPMALASALLALLKDRALAAQFAEQARRRVEALYPLGRMVDQTLEVYREASERLRILVIKLSALGDIALMTPSLRALRTRFPKAHITVLVGREGRELLYRSPYLDDLIVYDRRQEGGVLGILRFGKKLRVAQVDLVVDFQNSRISHWLGRLSGAPQRYGIAGRRWSWLLTHRATQVKQPMPPVEHQFRLLELLGIQGASSHLELWPGPMDEEKAASVLKDAWIAPTQPVVVIHPGGHSRWLSKRWPLERYAELIDALALRAKVRVVLTGSAEERELSEQIYQATRAKPVRAAGLTSLNELTALIRRAQVFVSGDTAALHIAAATGVPLIALFGSTDPVRHLPPSPQLKLLKANIPCSPCYRSVCYRVGSGHMECMKLISVEQVTEAVLDFLHRPVTVG